MSSTLFLSIDIRLRNDGTTWPGLKVAAISRNRPPPQIDLAILGWFPLRTFITSAAAWELGTRVAETYLLLSYTARPYFLLEVKGLNAKLLAAPFHVIIRYCYVTAPSPWDFTSTFFALSQRRTLSLRRKNGETRCVYEMKPAGSIIQIIFHHYIIKFIIPTILFLQ